MSNLPIRKFVKRFFQLIIILVSIAGTGFIIWLLVLTRPEAEKKEKVAAKPLVEVIPVTLESHQLNVYSKGVVQAKKRTQLAAELSGKVVNVSDQFIVGGKFNTGDVILRIDPSTYISAFEQAQASVIEAEVALTTEKARAAQAKRDWARLGRGQPSELTLRVPQIRSAEARIKAAKVALEKARVDKDERVLIKAPFNATVSRKNTEKGNYLAPGSLIGEFFQTDPLEIRLPISLDDLAILDTGPGGQILGKLTLSTKIGNRTITWNSKEVRTEGQIDQQSRSIFLISEFAPDSSADKPVQLQPGLFLNAKVPGKTFNSIARVPVTAFLDLQRVVLVDTDDKLAFREVEVLLRDGDFVYVSNGLKPGDRLCVTELPTMIEGTEVDIRVIESNNPPNIIPADVK